MGSTSCANVAAGVRFGDEGRVVKGGRYGHYLDLMGVRPRTVTAAVAEIEGYDGQSLSGKTPLQLSAMEAERRLFYVAFTRARKKVIMLIGQDAGPMSPFIQELVLKISPMS